MAPSDPSLAASSPNRQSTAMVAPPHAARHSPGRSKRVRIQAFREVPINTLKLQRLNSGRASPLKLPPSAILQALPSSQNPQAPTALRPSSRGPLTTSLLSSILGTNPLPLSRPHLSPPPPPPTQLSSNQPKPSTAAPAPAPATTAATPSTTTTTTTTTPSSSPAAPATASATTTAAAAAAPSTPLPTPTAEPASTATAAAAPLSFWSLRRPAVNPRTVELLMTREVLCLPPDLVSHDLPSCSEMAALANLDCSDVEALLAECSC